MEDMKQTIFNTAKTAEEYGTKKLFGVGEMPLLDTVHSHYPKIKALYHEMCALKWSENEIDFSQCLIDFEQAPKDMSEMMLKTLAWQWHNDSIAAQAPTTIIAPFEPCTEVWETEVEITSNELTHGLTYSEIVRMGFKDPSKVLEDILKDQEVYERSATIGKYLRQVQLFSTTYAYLKITGGELPSDYEIKKHLIIYYFIMLCLERIKFMASFAITFTIVKSGYFIPIGSAVMKICQDEGDVHAEFRKEMLKELTSDELGKQVFEELKPLLTTILEEIVDEDITWTKEFIFENGNKSLVGTNADIVSQMVLFFAKDVVNSYKLSTKYSFPKTHPMPHLIEFMDLSKTQMAPMEQDIVSYVTQVIDMTDKDQTFNYNFT